MPLKIDIATAKTVLWPVTVNEPRDGGSVYAHRCKVRFEILPQDEMNAVLRDNPGEGDAALLRRAVKGWEDVEIDFSEEALAQLVQIPYVRNGFVAGYLQAAGGAKAKN